MESWILEWIEANRDWALLLVPLFAFSEACVGIGIFVPSLILVVVSSFLLAQELAAIPTIMLLAFCAAVAGDHVGFYVGRALGPQVHHWKLVQRHASKIARAEALIQKRGAWAILIGRFIPAIRSLIPATLGISGFDRLRYSLVDLCACALWAVGLGLILTGVAQF